MKHFGIIRHGMILIKLCTEHFHKFAIQDVILTIESCFRGQFNVRKFNHNNFQKRRKSIHLIDILGTTIFRQQCIK
ncbi:hypothetical protein D3C72_1403810 [compost metagenome]